MTSVRALGPHNRLEADRSCIASLLLKEQHKRKTAKKTHQQNNKKSSHYSVSFSSLYITIIYTEPSGVSGRDPWGQWIKVLLKDHPAGNTLKGPVAGKRKDPVLSIRLLGTGRGWLLDRMGRTSECCLWTKGHRITVR